MTTQEILATLKELGTEPIRKVLANHGAPVTHYGVKIEDLKKIQKKVKKDYALSLELFDTLVPDAQYLAGLIADEKKMTKKDLRHWARESTWTLVSEYTVAWIAAESAHGWELALEWIDDKTEPIQVSGWNTLASLVAIRPDEALDIAGLKKLLQRVRKEIHTADNRVRYNMNTFLISVGGYVSELSEEAMKVAESIGHISVDVGKTSCKVPYAPDYIRKMKDRCVRKKKMARC